MIARFRRWLDLARRVRVQQAEIRSLNAALLTTVVKGERERALAIMAAGELVERVGMIVPDSQDRIADGTAASVFLRQAEPRFRGVVESTTPTIH